MYFLDIMSYDCSYTFGLVLILVFVLVMFVTFVLYIPEDDLIIGHNM
jgi:hypothetical protein